MTKYREILRLESLGISQRSIAESCECARNTVARVIRRAADAGISWPLDENLSDEALGKILFGERVFQSTRKQPDYEYIHLESLFSPRILPITFPPCRVQFEILTHLQRR
jgi:hypothetical protein